ncbi:DUF1294 domain-containing protein [Evansella tamaricis]|uniref:DUF1294 domain-containing protein n=1 Tax=Evansella tamaricis TaxID=2069301 RepID=A0ABS6JKH3_9BACI|nr:DUF1294 domain-containing protein [Evansella tamaricis]MBU9714162.1 DUF1294 domain-containing protein [Evansella tamaricis]
MENLIRLFFITINILGFILMILDKNYAKKGRWRISEPTLIGIAFVGGALGMLLASKFFRHKTKKNLFRIGLPLLFIAHALIFTFVLYGYSF